MSSWGLLNLWRIHINGVVSEPDPPRSYVRHEVPTYVLSRRTYDVTERGGSGSETISEWTFSMSTIHGLESFLQPLENAI